jgi:hypothetical protein
MGWVLLLGSKSPQRTIRIFADKPNMVKMLLKHSS